jgi:hypothetical protein
MAADGLVRSLDELARSETNPYRWPSDRLSRPDHPTTRLPLRIRALLVIGLAIVAWLPIAAGYAIANWL